MTTIVWFRRDLRLQDHPALHAACQHGGPVVPVFIHDEATESLGAAPAWRLEQSLASFERSLDAKGSRLILRRGAALAELRKLIQETGADRVVWMRGHDPDWIARDTKIKQALGDMGVTAQSFAGQLLHEPWEIKTGQGTPYRVFTPFWKAVRGLPVPAPVPAPDSLAAPAQWPRSDRLQDWRLGQRMHRGGAVLGRYCACGETAALEGLTGFLADRLRGYAGGRDQMATEGTSGLSAFLATGEVSVRTCWHAAMDARQQGNPGAEPFLRQLVWRDFAWHLLFHYPHMARDNWREGWERFPWRSDPAHPHVLAWQQGRTGVALVDAGMRQLMVTGTMHNRARMLVASFLTKHLLTDWRIGQTWFEDHLIDWDAANNAMGWQWVAGSGPDAAPYFRIFNPDLQAKRFDADGRYRQSWLAEGQQNPPDTALAWFDAIPKRWNQNAAQPAAAPIVPLDEGRKAALAAYESLKS